MEEFRAGGSGGVYLAGRSLHQSDGPSRPNAAARMSRKSLPAEVREAIAALHEKKAGEITLLDMQGAASFTDYFLICTSYSRPQSKAIADEVDRRLSRLGHTATGREDGEAAEWVLLDHLNLIVHVFQERARNFYDLERLWSAARRVPLPEEEAVEKRSAE